MLRQRKRAAPGDGGPAKPKADAAAPISATTPVQKPAPAVAAGKHHADDPTATTTTSAGTAKPATPTPPSTPSVAPSSSRSPPRAPTNVCFTGRRRRGGPCICCGVRVSRRLRQPGVAASLACAAAGLGLLGGMFLGALLAFVVLHAARVDVRAFSPSLRGGLDLLADVVFETAHAIGGSDRICYRGTRGVRPFAEHDGAFEDLSRVSVTYEVQEWYPKPVSQFQDMEVFRSKFFGNVLVIDDEIMITERDESHYHEMLAHVPLAYGSQARRVLIVGGGDGGTLGQVLRHTNVEHVTVVELDPAVVAASRQYFPEIAVSFDDPRVTLVHENGAKWVSEYAGRSYQDNAALDSAFTGLLGEGDERIRATRRPVVRAAQRRRPGAADSHADVTDGEDRGHGSLRGPAFDLVLVDSTDFGVATPLFTREFYENVRRILNPENGMLAFNVESPSWAEQTVTTVTHFLSSIFRHAYPFQLFQPTYSSGHYAFLLASDTVHPFRTPVDWSAFRGKGFADQLRYYSPEVHYGAFALPARIPGSRRVRLEDLWASLDASTLELPRAGVAKR